MTTHISAYHAQYYAHELTRLSTGDERMNSALFNAKVELNPHQIDAALFALNNPLRQGVLLADEVGLGKTIEAGLVICQLWAERKRKLLVVCPASLRKQWQLELSEKFDLPSIVVDKTIVGKQKGVKSSTALGKFFERQVGTQVLVWCRINLSAKIKRRSWGKRGIW